MTQVLSKQLNDSKIRETPIKLSSFSDIDISLLRNPYTTKPTKITLPASI